MERKQRMKNYIQYFIPSMLGMALLAVYTFVDTFVVGRRYGAIAFGAMGICTPIVTVAYASGYLFGLGGASLYSISKGKGDQERAERIFTTSFFAALTVGLIVMALLNIFIYPVAYFLGADAENISYVIPYLRCVCVYFPGFMMDIVMLCYIRNSGHPNVAMMATVIGTGMNLVLDFLFVFGFDWGMFGAAFATCLCSGLSFCIDFGYALVRKLDIRPAFRKVRVSLLPGILKNGASSFVMEASSGIVIFVFIARATALYGTIGSSIYTIIMNWSLIAVNLMLGIGQAAQPLMSRGFGSRNMEDLRGYRQIGLAFSLAFGIAYLIIGLCFTDPLVSVFATDSTELIRLAERSFRLYLPAFFIMSVGIFSGVFFQAIGKAAPSFILMVARGIALPVAFAFLFSAIGGKTGLWLAMPAAEFVTSVLVTSVLGIIFTTKYELQPKEEKEEELTASPVKG